MNDQIILEVCECDGSGEYQIEVEDNKFYSVPCICVGNSLNEENPFDAAQTV